MYSLIRINQLYTKYPYFNVLLVTTLILYLDNYFSIINRDNSFILCEKKYISQ